MMNKMVQLLEKKVGQLVHEYETIKEENTVLRQRVDILTKELEEALKTSSNLKDVEDRIGQIINSIDALMESGNGGL